jgi:hypothetical protein
LCQSGDYLFRIATLLAGCVSVGIWPSRARFSTASRCDWKSHSVASMNTYRFVGGQVKRHAATHSRLLKRTHSNASRVVNALVADARTFARGAPRLRIVVERTALCLSRSNLKKKMAPGARTRAPHGYKLALLTIVRRWRPISSRLPESSLLLPQKPMESQPNQQLVTPDH